jgi:hypothetical protein
LDHGSHQSGPPWRQPFTEGKQPVIGPLAQGRARGGDVHTARTRGASAEANELNGLRGYSGRTRLTYARA